jgi:hypothetical protein
VAAKDVTVSDPRTPSCDRTFHTLAAGKSTSYNCTRTGVTDGFRNIARVQWKSPTGVLGAATSRVVHVTVAPQKPAIAIVKGPADQTIDRGRAHFRIEVRNTGNVPLHAVSVVDPAAPDCSRTLAAIAPGHSRSYECNGATVEHSYTNIATATGTSPSGTRARASGSAFVRFKSSNPQFTG